MKLHTVTITGAADDTPVAELVALSKEFPFVEWGILVSWAQEGSGRFPSRAWMDAFLASAAEHNLNVSTHLCGSFVRDLLAGQLAWPGVPPIWALSRRIQINTHGKKLTWGLGMLRSMDRLSDKQFIFQWDGVNDRLAYVAYGHGSNVAALFDLSAGAGILPERWSPPETAFPCGYAGGLGPDNVAEQLERIAEVCQVPFWIDMERRVRSEDDSILDLAKVRRVLEICAPHAEP